jgi:hypothetical protein
LELLQSLLAAGHVLAAPQVAHLLVARTGMHKHIVGNNNLRTFIVGGRPFQFCTVSVPPAKAAEPPTTTKTA